MIWCWTQVRHWARADLLPARRDSQLHGEEAGRRGRVAAATPGTEQPTAHLTKEFNLVKFANNTKGSSTWKVVPIAIVQSHSFYIEVSCKAEKIDLSEWHVDVVIPSQTISVWVIVRRRHDELFPPPPANPPHPSSLPIRSLMYMQVYRQLYIGTEKFGQTDKRWPCVIL
jgi:hypothetical protein